MKENLEQGDTVVVDAAVFHRVGVDGACHIENGIEYVVMEEEDDEVFMVLTVEQEEELDNSIAGVLYTLTVSCENGVESMERHPQVYEVKSVNNCS